MFARFGVSRLLMPRGNRATEPNPCTQGNEMDLLMFPMPLGTSEFLRRVQMGTLLDNICTVRCMTG